MTSTILVTGATGNVGGALVELLQAHDVRLRTLPPEPRPLDRATLARLAEGADAVFLACGNVPEQVVFECDVIDAAAAAGVRRIVKLSARGADPDAPVMFWRWHAEIERHLAASRVPSVVLRPGFLMSNLFAAAQHVREQGMLAAPTGSARIAMTHPGDVAAAAAAALTGDLTTDRLLPGPGGTAYELTGPAGLTYADAAADLAAATSRPVAHVDVPPEAFGAALLDAGLPPFVVDRLLEVFAALRRGEQAEPTEDVQRLTGRAPQGLAGWATAYADAFRPAPAPAGVR